jgi:glyceraldehyde 3-phosphate dehydrogenase
MAFRVPTPDVSLIDFVAVVRKRPTIDEINAAFKEATKGKMKGILAYDEEPLVSVDYVHSPYSAIVDGTSTLANGNTVKVVAWYDNEYGYSCRTVELAEKMVKGL